MVTSARRVKLERELSSTHSSQQGALMIELIVALTILTLVLIPISFSFLNDQRACRGFYYRSIAMEMVDGEMEILRAGAWRQVKEGQQIYPVHGDAAKNLPPGKFILTRDQNQLRLEWLPAKWGCGGKVVREMRLEK